MLRLIQLLADFGNWKNLVSNPDWIRYRYIISKEFVPVNTVMDIGSRDHPQDLIPSTVELQCDPYYEYTYPIQTGKYTRFPIEWKQALELMKTHSIDAVTLIDVIEHIDKRTAFELLSETQRYTNLIVVFTPIGFMEQTDGEYNTHRSGWEPSDFGEGWVVHTFPNFHKVDFMDNMLETPHGAMLAIYRKPN